MNKKELKFIQQEGEGYKTEFKESFEPKNLSKDIIGFANAQGGRIFLGINDSGKIKGMKTTNKLAITNPGGLVKWLKPEDFGKISSPRNQLIAELLSKTEYIEKLGTGIKRIRQAMKKAGLPAPVFNYNSSFEIELYDKTKVGEKVGENQKKILEIIKKNPRISAKQISLSIGISARKTEENIAKLKKKGLLKRKGPAKGGHWEITK